MKEQKDTNNKIDDDEKRALVSAGICLVSILLMSIAQIPSPDYLNPAGCVFALAAMTSGIYSAVLALFIWA